MSPPPVALPLPSTDAKTLLSHLETLELNYACENKPHPYPAAHLLCLLLTNDLSEARFLWRRLPPTCKEDASTRTTWSLARALWTDSLDQFYSAANFAWPPHLSPLVQQLVEQTRNKSIKAIPIGYETISIQLVGKMVGLCAPQVEHLARQVGWQVEEDYIRVMPQDNDRRAEGAAVELQTLTEQLIRLQTSA